MRFEINLSSINPYLKSYVSYQICFQIHSKNIIKIRWLHSWMYSQYTLGINHGGRSSLRVLFDPVCIQVWQRLRHRCMRPTTATLYKIRHDPSLSSSTKERFQQHSPASYITHHIFLRGVKHKPPSPPNSMIRSGWECRDRRLSLNHRA